MIALICLVFVAFASVQVQAQTEECENCSTFIQRFFKNFAKQQVQPITGEDTQASLFNRYNISGYNKASKSSACIQETSSNPTQKCYTETMDFTLDLFVSNRMAEHKASEYPAAVLGEVSYAVSAAAPSCGISNGYDASQVNELPGLVGFQQLNFLPCVSQLTTVGLLNPNENLVLDIHFVWPNVTGKIAFDYCIENGQIINAKANLFKIETGYSNLIKTTCTDKTSEGLKQVCQCLNNAQVFRYVILKYLLLTFPCRKYNSFVTEDFLNKIACITP